MRFISVDPHPGDQDDPKTLNEYIYCRNNPVNYTDPDGDYVETAIDVASFAYSANEFKKKKSWGNFGWAAFDAAMIFLPIAPGSGVFRAGIKVSKGGKSAVKVSEASKISRAKFFSQAPKNATNFKTTSVGSRYLEFSYESAAKKAGPPARAVYRKTVTTKGKVIRVIKDTYNRHNKIIHRKFK
jgi:hypothetical protein